MCALVLALRKVPIAGPGGSDAALGSADKPSWSVAVPPADAVAAYAKYNAKKDAARLNPLNKPEDNDKGKSTSTDYLGTGVGGEGEAVNSLTSRRPGVDTVRDDTWNNRDDVSTLGRPSTDARPDLDEVRGLLHKATSAGKRKGGSTLSPSTTRFSNDIHRQSSSMAPLPSPAVTSPYAPPPGPPTTQLPPPPRSTAPGSPASVSTGYYEDVQFQTMTPQTMMPPPPRSTGRARAPTVTEEQQDSGERRWDPNTTPSGTNPYRSPSAHFKRQ